MFSTVFVAIVLPGAVSGCSGDGTVRSADTAEAGAGNAGVSAAASGAQAGTLAMNTGGASGAGVAGASGVNDGRSSAAANGGAAGPTTGPAATSGATNSTAGSAANSGAARTAAGGGAAGDGASSSSGIDASFKTVKLVFGGGGGITTCAAAPCHGVNGVAPPDDPLELPTNDDTRLYATLTSYVSRACASMKLVEPGKPEQSALLAILKGPCGMTPRMPYGCSAEAGDCIPDEYIAAVSQWITNGAPRE